MLVNKNKTLKKHSNRDKNAFLKLRIIKNFLLYNRKCVFEIKNSKGVVLRNIFKIDNTIIDFEKCA